MKIFLNSITETGLTQYMPYLYVAVGIIVLIAIVVAVRQIRMNAALRKANRGDDPIARQQAAMPIAEQKRKKWNRLTAAASHMHKKPEENDEAFAARMQAANAARDAAKADYENFCRQYEIGNYSNQQY